MRRSVLVGALLVLMVCFNLIGCGRTQDSVDTTDEQTPEWLIESIVSSWSISEIKPILPEEEARFEVIWAEMPYVESIYDKNNLRLYLSPADMNQDTIFACMVNSSNPAYENIKSWEPTDNFDIVHSGDFTVICNKKLIRATTFDELKNGLHTYDSLVELIGTASFRDHVHGVGSYTYEYFPQGLTFIECERDKYRLFPSQWPDNTSPIEDPDKLAAFNRNLTYEDYLTMQSDKRKNFALECFEQQKMRQEALAQGKKSPDGKYTAGSYTGHVFWKNYIVIASPDSSENLINLGDWLFDYQWFDNENLVLVKSFSDLYLLNIKSLEITPIADFRINPPEDDALRVDPGEKIYFKSRELDYEITLTFNEDASSFTTNTKANMNMYYDNGNLQYKGEVKYDDSIGDYVPHGMGIEYYEEANGQKRYEGKFVDGAKTTEGTWYDLQGEQLIAYFEPIYNAVVPTNIKKKDFEAMKQLLQEAQKFCKSQGLQCKMEPPFEEINTDNLVVGILDYEPRTSELYIGPYASEWIYRLQAQKDATGKWSFMIVE